MHFAPPGCANRLAGGFLLYCIRPAFFCQDASPCPPPAQTGPASCGEAGPKGLFQKAGNHCRHLRPGGGGLRQQSAGFIPLHNACTYGPGHGTGSVAGHSAPIRVRGQIAPFRHIHVGAVPVQEGNQLLPGSRCFRRKPLCRDAQRNSLALRPAHRRRIPGIFRHIPESGCGFHLRRTGHAVKNGNHHCSGNCAVGGESSAATPKHQFLAQHEVGIWVIPGTSIQVGESGAGTVGLAGRNRSKEALNKQLSFCS